MKLTVLILEEDFVKLRQLQQAIKALSYHVVERTCLESGIDYIKTSAVHLIITGLEHDKVKKLITTCPYIPLVFFGQVVEGYPHFFAPFKKEELQSLIVRYAVPMLEKQQMQEKIYKLSMECEALKQNVELQQSYIRKAGTIQKSMLKKRQYPGKDVSIYAKTNSLSELGGDFYYYKLFDDELFFCIGDVVDHGADAAIYMTELTAFLISLLQKRRDVLYLAQRFNYLGSAYNREGLTATAFIGCLNLKTGLLQYCNIAHEAPLIVGDTVRTLEQPMFFMPVGCNKDEAFEVFSTYLRPNEKLLLYTDGLIEEYNGNGVGLENGYGLARLIQTTSVYAKENAKGLCKNILNDVQNYVAGNSWHDDVTLLCIERSV